MQSFSAASFSRRSFLLCRAQAWQLLHIVPGEKCHPAGSLRQQRCTRAQALQFQLDRISSAHGTEARRHWQGLFKPKLHLPDKSETKKCNLRICDP